MTWRAGPLNGAKIGDILIDTTGKPWRFHSFDHVGFMSINVMWIWKEEEAWFARTHLYPHEPQSHLRDGFRRASPLEQLALVEEGYVLDGVGL